MAQTSEKDLLAMNLEVERACELLASTTPDVVAYACTSGSFISGHSGLDSLLERMQKIANCPIVATSKAMLDAFRAVGAQSIALVTPYPDPITESEADFISQSGFSITYAKGLGRSGKDVRQSPRKDISALVIEAACSKADAIFVSCTDLPAFEFVSEWEQGIGIPVLTSNQVTIWSIINTLKSINKTPSNLASLKSWVETQTLFTRDIRAAY